MLKQERSPADFLSFRRDQASFSLSLLACTEDMKEPFNNLHSTLSHNVMVLSYSLLNSLNNEQPHQRHTRSIIQLENRRTQSAKKFVSTGARYIPDPERNCSTKSICSEFNLQNQMSSFRRMTSAGTNPIT